MDPIKHLEELNNNRRNLIKKAEAEAANIPMDTIRKRGAFNIQNDDNELIRRHVFRKNFILKSVEEGLTYKEIGKALNRDPKRIRKMHEKFLLRALS